MYVGYEEHGGVHVGHGVLYVVCVWYMVCGVYGVGCVCGGYVWGVDVHGCGVVGVCSIWWWWWCVCVGDERGCMKR